MKQEERRECVSSHRDNKIDLRETDLTCVLVVKCFSLSGNHYFPQCFGSSIATEAHAGEAATFLLCTKILKDVC